MKKTASKAAVSSLAQLRRRIDRLDRQLVRLLNQRTGLAVAIGRIKHEQGAPVYSPAREREVMARVAAHGSGPLGPSALRSIYREIMSAALASEGGLRVGVLREEGCGAWAAGRRRFGDATRIRAYAGLPALLRAPVAFLLVGASAWRSAAAEPDVAGWMKIESVRGEAGAGAFLLLARKGQP